MKRWIKQNEHIVAHFIVTSETRKNERSKKEEEDEVETEEEEEIRIKHGKWQTKKREKHVYIEQLQICDGEFEE